MKETGTVTERDGDFVYVRITRKSACGGNCAECGGCAEKERTVKAKNCDGLEKGDTAILETETKNVLTAAFLVYIVPLILLAAGFLLAEAMTKNNIICVLCGFIFMVIGFFFIRIYDQKNEKTYLPSAFRRVDEEKEK